MGKGKRNRKETALSGKPARAFPVFLLCFATPFPPSMTFHSRPRSELWQLLLLVTVILAVPLFLPADPPPSTGKRGVFDQKRLEKTIQRQPEVILVGNSMLNTRIERPLFDAMVQPNQTAYLAEGGTRSLAWWLFMKNFAGPLNPPPKVAFIFYRDYDFTSPGMNLEGAWLDTIRTLMKPEDEDLLAHLRKTSGAETNPLLDSYLPNKLSRDVRRRLRNLAVDAGAMGGGSEGDNQLEEELNDLFDFENLRANVLDAGALANDAVPPDTQNFSIDPANSLLEHFNTFAKERGMRLVFYRVKRRPGADNTVIQDATLREYTREFRRWAESQGHALVDETEDPRLVLSMYHDGDHLSRAARSEYTPMFVERISSLLPVPPAPASAPAPQP